jgi:poly(A) polymerase Pap1
VLPKVVAENLFPSKEEDRTADIFNSLINYDLELEKFYVNQEKPKEKSKCEQAINNKETETLRT